MIDDSKHSTPKSYWIRLVVIFFLGWIVIYAGRSVLSPLVGELQTQFGLTKVQTGGIMSLFFLLIHCFKYHQAFLVIE